MGEIMKMAGYDGLGVKVGLEIHQQLASKKLFCNCSTDLREKNMQIEIRRKLRASAGEIGEIDIAAEYEEAKDRTYVYRGYEGEYCLIDVDEEPPYRINEDALKTALGVATLLRLKIPDFMQVMRKVIIDGSACSAFQRTILIGLESDDSYLITRFGKVKVSSLCLEEDACKIEKVDNGKVYYSLSRQGIPLLEIRTEPDMKNGEEAKETAALIGMILRSFGDVKRGIGTIRQDVNVSIKGGARVELKGFQDLRNMPKIIDNEIKRQLEIISSSKKVESEVRKVNPDGLTAFLRPMPGYARMYPETDVISIGVTKDTVDSIRIPELLTEKAIKLEKRYGLSAEIARELIEEEKFEIFEDYCRRFKVEPILVARILVGIPKEIKARFNIDAGNISMDEISALLESLEKMMIARDAVMDIMVLLAKGEKVDFARYRAVSEDELEREVEMVIEKNKGASISALMGEIMKKYRGKVDGKKVMDLLAKKLGSRS